MFSRGSFLGVLLAVFSLPVWAINTYVTVADGNVEALKSWLADAQSRRNETRVIRLGGTFRFGPDDALPEVSTDVSLFADQGPAHFVGVEGGPVNLITVTRNGSLRMTNVSFENFHPIVTDGSANAGLLVNNGSLELSGIQFTDNFAALSSAGCCRAFKPLVLNTRTGNLRLAQVSMINSGVQFARFQDGDAPGAFLTNRGDASVLVTQVYLADPRVEPPFLNSGDIRFRNVTFMARTIRQEPRQDWITSSGSFRVSNSIVDGFAADWCDAVFSAGYNLVDNPQCGIRAAQDIVGQPTGLRWRPVNADWLRADDQILTHALVPIAGSAAIDSANDEWCPEFSLPDYNSFSSRPRAIDGNGDGLVRCDRGAFEIGRNTLASGGINGLYFNPDADGHYVYVADTATNTMVMWTTFDSRGKQAWIFGIAEKPAAGRSLVATAYLNRDGRVSLAGDFDSASSEHWGYLEFELTDCNQGTFGFRSELDEFGSGEFDIQRLAFLRQLDCEHLLGGN